MVMYKQSTNGETMKMIKTILSPLTKVWNKTICPDFWYCNRIKIAFIVVPIILGSVGGWYLHLNHNKNKAAEELECKQELIVLEEMTTMKEKQKERLSIINTERGS